MNNFFIRRAITLSSLLVTLATLGVSCSSDGGGGKLKIGPGGIETEWQPNPNTGPLPGGWTPQEEREVEIDVNGKKYRVRLCIARNPSNPTCIYVNTRACDASTGWRLVCQTSGGSEDPPPPGDILETSSEFKYHEITGQIEASFVLPADMESSPGSLSGTTVTTSTVAEMPFAQYVTHFGLPTAGAVLTVSGDAASVSWDAFSLGVVTLEHQTEAGKVEAAIYYDEEIPPIYVVVLNGEVIATETIAKP